MNDVRFVFSKEDLAAGPGTRLDHCRAFVWQSLVMWKRKEKASDRDIRRGGECPCWSKQGRCMRFQLAIAVNQKDPSRLSWSYWTHSHNIRFKMTGLVRRFSRRRNMSSSRVHCRYIILSAEFKGKRNLEQADLSCWAIISSGLKEKKSLSFSAPWEPQTPLSSAGTPDFLSTHLGIDSLTF